MRAQIVLKCIVDGLVFAGDEIEISLPPSLLVTFLRPCNSPHLSCYQGSKTTAMTMTQHTARLANATNRL